jgi:mono/diheme cytochrome c family protein
MFRQWCFATSLTCVLVIFGVAHVRSVRLQADDVRLKPDATREAINKYCVTCHNDRLKTGGLTLADADVTHPATHAETWEKVVRKLRTGAMPPAGAPRPDSATYASLASYLESELDREALAHPHPGKLSLVHRLSRTEYQNAIRDLLALDALPKEIDYSLLLPADNSSSGFDNIADLLFVSPAIMERYLDAAEKISRLAVGNPNAPTMVNRYRLHAEQWQGARVDELPWGTRGGLAVKSNFPADGDYLIKVQLAAPPAEPHQLEISIDGERAQIVTVGVNGAGRGRGRGARGPTDSAPPQPQPRTGEPEPDRSLDFRVSIKAGPRLVGITFIERDEVRDEATLRPRMRGRGPEPALSMVTISGPDNVKGPGDTPSRRRIFACHPSTRSAGSGSTVSPVEPSTELGVALSSPKGHSDIDPCAKRILSTLARRAFRRPVTDADLQDLLPFYNAGRVEGGFEAGIERALERLLVSPQFLFRVEHEPLDSARGGPGAAAGSAFRISELELASRLSFFLWSSIPDDELLEAAARGQLKDAAILETQVRRMLKDPRSESMVTNFAEQWLFLRDIESKQPDGLLFPDFDESLRSAMHRETELFVDSVLRENRSVLDLLTANYTYVNERLAKHYGIPNIEGSYFRRVTFPAGSTRGGLLGQGSILTLTSYATRTSPVVRGKWVLENLLSAAPPPPPPNIPALKTEGAEAGKTLTMRDAMIAHRANPSCASCHARMDPIGFAMENFDAVGQWRDRDAASPIDASGAFPDGTNFTGMTGLKKALLRDRDQFVNTVAEKLLMYALGRNLQYYDAPAVRSIVGKAAGSHYTLSSLVLGVVQSAPFQLRTHN